MTPTQEHLFKLLLEIDDICKRNGIEYWLEYGTALGAVRHEGFIPWDNDLDISMTEPNYDKFKEACARELDGETRTFCDSRTDRSIPHVFGHYVDLTCCRMTQRTAYWKYYVGQSIDVFCHVALPRDIEENKRVANLFYAYDEYVNQCFPHYYRKTDEINSLFCEMKDRERTIGREAVLQEAESQIFGHYLDASQSDMWMVTSARMNWSVFWPRHFYENLKEVTFEGRRFHVVSDWYEFFSTYYGDHFEQYPNELRIHTEMSHTDLPCRAYVDDFTRTVDVDAMLETRKRYKDLGFQNGYREQYMKPEFYRAVGSMVRHHIKRDIAQRGIDIAELLERGDLESVAVLREILAEYLEKQTHPSVFYWRTHLGLDDVVDEAGMYVLLVDGARVYDIDRIVQMRVFNDLPITDKMRWIQEAAHHVRDIKKYVHYDDLEKSRRHIEWAKSNLPEIEEVQVWDAFVRTLSATGNAGGEDAEQELRACLDDALALQRKYPHNDLCRKVQADATFALGRESEAWELYDALEKSTRDGFILLDIRKRRAKARNGE